MQLLALFDSRFEALGEEQHGALSELAQLLDDMHGSIQTIEIQTAEIKAISVNQMQVLTQLFKDESKFPRFFLMFKKEKIKTFYGSACRAAKKISTFGGSEYVLVIVCELCMRPCPCGRSKTGYSVNVPHELFLKIAPALFLGLKFFVVAAGIASGVTGIKLPLPSFASIDALLSTLQKAQDFLKDKPLIDAVGIYAASAFDDPAASAADAASAQVTAMADDTARSLSAASGRIQEATGDAYKSFVKILQKADPNAEFYGEHLSPYLPTYPPHTYTQISDGIPRT